MTEQEKYEAMWERPEYRNGSPGERVAKDFVQWAGVTKDDIVVDFGCGTGRGGKRVHELTGCRIEYVDFAANCLNEDVRDVEWARFYEADLSGHLLSLDVDGKLGFCTDVMEHLPPGQVMDAIRNIMQVAPRVFFQISLVHDSFGKLLGPDVHLHLSVFPFEWWLELFRALGYKVLRSEYRTNVGLFYVERKE